MCEFDSRPSVGHVFTFSQPLSGVLLARLENVEKICGMPVDDVAVSRFFADILCPDLSAKILQQVHVDGMLCCFAF